jgi:CheY-like chemotaxis protein
MLSGNAFWQCFLAALAACWVERAIPRPFFPAAPVFTLRLRGKTHGLLAGRRSAILASMAAALFLSSDLMFTSRLLGAAGTLGIALQTAASPAQLAGKLADDCRLVMIDLALDGLDLAAAVAAIRTAAPQAQIVAFGAHVNEAALAAAEKAGCDTVLPRGQFNKQYAELLRAAGG